MLPFRATVIDDSGHSMPTTLSRVPYQRSVILGLARGVDGLSDWVSTGRPPEISAEGRGRILALSRQSPPEETGIDLVDKREVDPENRVNHPRFPDFTLNLVDNLPMRDYNICET
jgi:hypothetical protein